MQTLVIAATAFEIAPFLKANPSADFLLTGVGIPATIYHLLKRLQQVDYDLVIQAGIAGSFGEMLKPGNVVLVKQDCFGDLGISEENKFYTLFEKKFAEADEFPFINCWLNNEHDIMNIFPYEQVSGVTVNMVTDDRLHIEKLINKYNPALESMEGAALHYTCLLEKIPFIQLRSISNYVGERNKSNWKMTDAIENLNNELTGMIKHFTHNPKS